MLVKLGISIVSLLRIGLPGPFPNAQTLIDEAVEDGWGGIQMLPVRGSTGYETGPIDAFEKAWNASPILNFFLRRNGTAGTPSMPHDVFVFPRPASCEKIEHELGSRGIPQIHHHFESAGNTGLIEVNPGLDMTPVQIAEICEEIGFRLVIDTSHLMRPYRADEIALKPERAGNKSPLGTTMDERDNAIRILAPHVVGFHLNVDRERYCKGFATEDDTLSECLAITSTYRDKVSVTVEIKPTLNPNMSRDRSREMLAVTRQQIGRIPGITIAD